ncbi:Alpha/Beta hydrolase protein, partial [Pavlovales sp. CCMP2436]
MAAGTLHTMREMNVRRGPLLVVLFALITESASGAVVSAGPHTFPAWMPADIARVREPAALRLAEAIVTSEVTVSTSISETGRIRTSYYKSPASAGTSGDPILLLHGFDSSCLEWRRLIPLLEQKGRTVVAPDILGWGFTDRSAVRDFSATAKLAHMTAFCELVIGVQSTVVGTSLGAAFAAQLAIDQPALAARLCLVDPQVLVDGTGPMASLPKPLAELGVNVLGTRWLRGIANKLSYKDPETFATEDAVEIGRLPVNCERWLDGNVGYMLSGGIAVSSLLPRLVQREVLLVWGREDAIVPAAESAPRLQEMLPNARLQYVEQCGHVPHLEQPQQLADILAQF